MCSKRASVHGQVSALNASNASISPYTLNHFLTVWLIISSLESSLVNFLSPQVFPRSCKTFSLNIVEKMVAIMQNTFTQHKRETQSYQEPSQKCCALCILSLGLSYDEIFLLVHTYKPALAGFLFDTELGINISARGTEK